MAAKPITWRIARWEGTYDTERYARDRENINKALERLEPFDVPSTPEAEDAIKTKIGSLNTPDDLRQTLAYRAQVLCKTDTVAPILFRGIFNWRDPKPNEGYTILFTLIPGPDPGWESLWDNWPTTAQKLNKVDLANRAEVRFRFEVGFGNQPAGLNWEVPRWMETAIHELGVHVTQGLHCIDMWRQGNDWLDVDKDGSLDHLLFRYSGYRRFSYWRNKMTPVQIAMIKPAVLEWNDKERADPTRGQAGLQLVNKFYASAAPESKVPYNFMLCWQLAEHFPNQANRLVRDTTDRTLVDMNQSQAFINQLRAQLDLIFYPNFQTGEATGRNAAFYWW